MRRIEALTGTAARSICAAARRLAKTAAAAAQSAARRGAGAASRRCWTSERKRLERELAEAKKKLAMGGGGAQRRRRRARRRRRQASSARAVDGVDLKDLRGLADEGKKQLGSGVVAIVGVTEDGKAGVVVGVTPDLTGRFTAVDLARKGCRSARRQRRRRAGDMAQAGGPDGSKAEAALKAIEGALAGS